MYVISPIQMQKLDEVVDIEFEQRLMLFLKENMSDEVASFDDTELSSMIRKMLKASLSMGVDSELGVAQFACISISVGMEFWNDVDVQKYLNDGSSDPNSQVLLLASHLSNGNFEA